MGYPRFLRSRNHKVIKYTGGNFTLTTTWAYLTGLELSLEAQTGDVIEVALSALVNNESNEGHFDVATTVAGSPVNYVSKAGTTPGGNGVVGWFRNSSTFGPFSGSAFITLQAGDISGGVVTLRAWGHTGASTKTVYASGDNAFTFAARNLGPVDPN